MINLRRKLRVSNWYQKDGPWDLIIGLRLYLILIFLLAPAIYIIIYVGIYSPILLLILGLSIWLIFNFVIFESRKSPKLLDLLGFILLIPSSSTIYLNFLLGLIIAVNHSLIGGIFINSSICIGSIIYFFIILSKCPFKRINDYFTSYLSNWAQRRSYKRIKKHILLISLFTFFLVSSSLIFIPTPVYVQKQHNDKSNQRIGIWTYGTPLDLSRENQSRFIDNDTLQMLSNNNIYFVYGTSKNKIGTGLLEDINRCRIFDIEVQLYISPTTDDYEFVNIWTFEDLRTEIEEVLDFLNESNFIGDPITTLVYDMEADPIKNFPNYGGDPNTINKLAQYYTFQELFNEFNKKIETNWGLKIRICSDTLQAIDFFDGDDDYINFWGLLSYEGATMSYMIYRRNNFHQNYVLNHCRLLKEGDTIILNSWKFEDYFCYGDIDCAIEDAQMVLGYPGKTLNLEIWALWYFLGSYGVEGVHSLIDALTSDRSTWPAIEIKNIFPYSFYWDILFYGVVLLDLYAPLFRLSFNML